LTQFSERRSRDAAPETIADQSEAVPTVTWTAACLVYTVTGSA